MHYRDVLKNALSITVQRGEEYGDALPSFVRAANIASAILGTKLTAFDIAVVMMSIKMSRLSHQRGHEDSWIDLAAYVGFAAQFSGPQTSDFNHIVLAQVQADMENQLQEFVKGENRNAKHSEKTESAA